jgi:hypothetical protein
MLGRSSIATQMAVFQKGNGSVYIEVLSRNLPGGTRENNETPENTWCPCWDFNPEPTEYEYEALQLRQIAWWEKYKRRDKFSFYINTSPYR